MKRGRLVIFILVVCGVAAAGALSFKSWPRLLGRSTGHTPVRLPTEALISSVPPFSTKEPERYQATRIITNVEQNETADQSLRTVVNRTKIARDGQKRREEYEPGTDDSLIYLETEVGQFILLPAKKLYADLDSTIAGNVDLDDSAGDSDDSPERLLNETRTIARYEMVGRETLAGRNTTKYRVTSGEERGTGPATVTLIWIDEALGMPVRSETSSPGETRKAKLTIELSDISQQVEPKLFELPNDYKKVTALELGVERSRIRNDGGAKAAAAQRP